MTISTNWMEMTPKKETPLFRIKCYLCRAEIEAFSDEIGKIDVCPSCKESIDPRKCDFLKGHL